MTVEPGSQLACSFPTGGRGILKPPVLKTLLFKFFAMWIRLVLFTFFTSSVRQFPKIVQFDRGTKFDNEVLKGLNRLM